MQVLQHLKSHSLNIQLISWRVDLLYGSQQILQREAIILYYVFLTII